ncbi:MULTISPECIES: hypothetical protein [unclassified Xanthobacter]|uniref:hypothetical protein n=1 Tax=unclassified Xanthobacter TaxID=2623496 RepID=UPI001F3433EE|nr:MULTISPECIES: hypothetical protein [unclassified Xanthobacter]
MALVRAAGTRRLDRFEHVTVSVWRTTPPPAHHASDEAEEIAGGPDRLRAAVHVTAAMLGGGFCTAITLPWSAFERGETTSREENTLN